MYKDKDKQREANREAMKRNRAQAKTQGITNCPPSGITEQGITPHGYVITERGNIRVSKPGDADYVPQCETTRAFIENRPKRPSTAKRGKDIKCFADLPADVQETIRTVSQSNEEFQKRVVIAIKYQHTFPGRYQSPGLSRTSSTTGASL